MNYFYTTITLFLCSLLSVATYGQLTSETMMIGSANRAYKQYLPTGLDIQNEQVSLVVILHGLGGTNTDMIGAGFNNLADTARIIAIYPQGTPNSFSQNSWNNGTLLSSTADDIGFMNAIVDEMIAQYNVDPTRVYFTGMSMGSIMSYHLACAMNGRIAAIGCMSGTMSTSDISDCNPSYQTPVIHFHGTADGTVPYDGSALPSLSLVPETMSFWKNVHDCDATADSLRITDSANDGLTVDRFRYDNCSPDASLELWRINGGTHTYFYEPLNDITEMIEIWRFFRKWSHPSPQALGLNSNSQGKLTIAPNPSQGIFTVEVPQEEVYTVTSMNGKTVASGRFSSGNNAVDLNSQSNGMYLLNVGGSVYKLVKH